MQTLENISPINVEERKKLDIKPGDTIRVTQRLIEKEKTRLQVFEGVVISVKHGKEPGATFTVRRAKGGYGVEKIFPLYSPMIDKIEIVRRSIIKRAKLYFLREKTARQSRQKLNKAFEIGIATESFEEEKKKLLEEERQRELEAKRIEEEKAKKEAEEKAKLEAEEKAKKEAEEKAKIQATEEKTEGQTEQQEEKPDVCPIETTEEDNNREEDKKEEENSEENQEK